MDPISHPGGNRTRSSRCGDARRGGVDPTLRDRALRREALLQMDPLAVDRTLPEVAQALGAGDVEIASLAERLLGLHPLFCLRKGLWAPLSNGETSRRKAGSETPERQPACFGREFFSERQIAETARVLAGLVERAAGDARLRLMEVYSRFPGLDNLLDWRTLAWMEDERDYFEQLLLRRSLREFKRQMTVVLSYQCNKRCPYCFSDALLQRLSRNIRWEDFMSALEWGQRSGVARVPVTGGEPTLHPEFPRMMAEIRARNLTTCFSTNGCVPRAVFDSLSPDFVEAVTFHIMDDAEYAPGEPQQLEENIRYVCDKRIPIVLRYVLAGRRPPARYLELAARYHPWMLTFSPVFPGPLRREMNRDVRALFYCKDDILELAEAATRLRVRPVLAKPVPLCMFSREELVRLTAMATLENTCDVAQNEYTNNTLVNPDLSLFPCMALPLTGERLSPALSLEGFGRSSRQAVEPLQRTAMLEECLGCQLFQRQLCQPACLAFALSPA